MVVTTLIYIYLHPTFIVLPKDLLEVYRSKSRIYPKFAWSDLELRLAEKIIEIYQSCVGKKYGLILEMLRRIENASNYRKVRGFAKIIERGCEFEKCTHLDPFAVRTFLFERGYVTKLSERERILREAAEHFGVSVEEIERAMFADRDEEKVLVKVPDITPSELVKRYNLSLLQTLIFNCLRLSFWISTNHKEVFRKLKWLGLMYELYDEDGRLLTDVTGTASILKMTRKYGTSMAKLIPEILKAQRWWIRAEIIDEYEKRIYIFELTDKKRNLFPLDYSEEIEFDSSLEEVFYRRMRNFGFEVIREPGIVKAGNSAYIPDFLIRKGDKEVYVEIAGFWTVDYIKKKLEKIKLANIPIILIVKEEFALDKPKGVTDVILIKKNKIPYGEVLRKVKMLIG
jgi:predicted nuclease of restriction endonuclease-like RecB superfamily